MDDQVDDEPDPREPVQPAYHIMPAAGLGVTGKNRQLCEDRQPAGAAFLTYFRNFHTRFPPAVSISSMIHSSFLGTFFTRSFPRPSWPEFRLRHNPNPSIFLPTAR